MELLLVKNVSDEDSLLMFKGSCPPPPPTAVPSGTLFALMSYLAGDVTFELGTFYFKALIIDGLAK